MRKLKNVGSNDGSDQGEEEFGDVGTSDMKVASM